MLAGIGVVEDVVSLLENGLSVLNIRQDRGTVNLGKSVKDPDNEAHPLVVELTEGEGKVGGYRVGFILARAREGHRAELANPTETVVQLNT